MDMKVFFFPILVFAIVASACVELRMGAWSTLSVCFLPLPCGRLSSVYAWLPPP